MCPSCKALDYYARRTASMQASFSKKFTCCIQHPPIRRNTLFYLLEPFLLPTSRPARRDGRPPDLARSRKPGPARIEAARTRRGRTFMARAQTERDGGPPARAGVRPGRPCARLRPAGPRRPPPHPNWRPFGGAGPNTPSISWDMAGQYPTMRRPCHAGPSIGTPDLACRAHPRREETIWENDSLPPWCVSPRYSP